MIRLVSQAGHSVHLHCSVPMWSSPSDTCLDLHNLHDLRSRILLFIHLRGTKLSRQGTDETERRIGGS
ncbi:hypothetical protein K503DRAFT_166743 [Rhizopogon vinicolor AM-OR11-026]|uniref:Uncharacterized protein n=1 Tax=Rhizopogon vinicolor AM-OR11-026 TaxID=1314800 RepID=A0A1B7MDV8_9AGAM|nr:hypothetical protein K503DRAFT_166743 [Rhizopogon vinicolor AM-OR11-026]